MHIFDYDKKFDHSKFFIYIGGIEYAQIHAILEKCLHLTQYYVQ